jgi:hypothetical protein
MTKNEIIEMAILAGLEQDGEMWFSNTYKTDMDVHISHLEAFAKLVAAKEREQILAISAKQWFKSQHDLEEAIRARGEA